MDMVLTEDGKWEVLKTWCKKNDIDPIEVLEAIKDQNLATVKKKHFKDLSQLEFAF